MGWVRVFVGIEIWLDWDVLGQRFGWDKDLVGWVLWLEIWLGWIGLDIWLGLIAILLGFGFGWLRFWVGLSWISCWNGDWLAELKI